MPLTTKLFVPFLMAYALFGVSNMRADSLGKTFAMTTTDAMIAGNKVLPPGTYVWKLLDSEADHHIVQISDKQTGRIETTLIALPKYREVASADNRVDFWQTPKGLPRAVRAWFCPGDNYGQEFAYPGRLLAKLAAEESTQVASSEPKTTTLAFVLRPKLVAAKRVLLRRPRIETKQNSAPTPEGSWAVITSGGAAAPAHPTPPKRPAGLWARLGKLPLTATLAPLVGTIGIVSLAFYLLSFAKRRNGKHAV